jgi:hypothetical protein
MTMIKDPLVEEVRSIREAYARQFGYDLAAICLDLKEQELRSGRQVVTLKPKPVAEAKAGEKAA